MAEKNKKVKVLFLISAFAYGAGKVMLDILKYIDRDKFEPTLAFLWRRENEHFNALQEDIRLYDLKAGNYGITTQIPKLIWRMKGVINKEDPDVVVSLLWDANILNVLTNKIFTKGKTIVCEHTAPEGGFLNVFGEGLKTSVALKLTGFLYSGADAVVAVSRGIKKELLELGVSGNVHMISNPLDFSRIHALKDEAVNVESPYILYVGQLGKSKNVALLINAFKKIEDSADVNLVLMGDGPEKKALMEMAESLNIGSRVKFIGYDANPFKYMRGAELLVLPSNTESLGLVLVEAMACKCPVISTNCKWGPEETIENGVNGFLTPVGDVDAMSNSIKTLLNDKGLREKFILNSMKKLNDFDPGNQTRKYEKLIQSVTLT